MLFCLGHEIAGAALHTLTKSLQVACTRCMSTRHACRCERPTPSYPPLARRPEPWYGTVAALHAQACVHATWEERAGARVLSPWCSRCVIASVHGEWHEVRRLDRLGPRAGQGHAAALRLLRAQVRRARDLGGCAGARVPGLLVRRVLPGDALQRHRRPDRAPPRVSIPVRLTR